MEHGKELEVDEVVLGNGTRGEEDGLREEISLKEGAAFGDGDAELDVIFDFFGDEPRAATGSHGVDFVAELMVGGLEINFDEIGESEKRGAGGLGEESVEGETVTLFPEGETTIEEFGIGVDILEDLEDGGLGREEGDEAFDEGVAGTVDEGGGARGVGNEQQPVVDDLAGGEVGIAGEVIRFAGTVEELVSEEAALGIENGLTAEEAAGRGQGREGSRRSGRYGWWRGGKEWHARSQIRRGRAPRAGRFTLFIGGSERNIRAGASAFGTLLRA